MSPSWKQKNGWAQNREEVEGGVGLGAGRVHVVAEPGPVERRAAERIAAGPGEGVPPSHCEAQMVLQSLASDHLVGIVMPEGQLVAAVRPFIGDWGDPLEIAHRTSFRAP